MNLGRNILELRRNRNVTQEALAAQLGVTAAAVSKWENGYTFPDISMPCALADFFGVTTDSLLGRGIDKKCAVILAADEALGKKIADLIKEYHFEPCGIFTDEAAALAAGEDPQIGYIIVGVHQNGFWSGCPLQKIVSCHSTDAGILQGLRLALKSCLYDIFG